MESFEDFLLSEVGVGAVPMAFGGWGPEMLNVLGGIRLSSDVSLDILVGEESGYDDLNLETYPCFIYKHMRLFWMFLEDQSLGFSRKTIIE